MRHVIQIRPNDVFTRESQMLNCQNCGSHNVRWFTPRRYAQRAAVLLCMHCRRLTILSPHAQAAWRGTTEKAA